MSASNTPRKSEAWMPRPLAKRVVEPIERFMHVEASSGIVLLVAATVALVWANSPLHESYDALWHTHFSITLGPWTIDHDLHFWINDFLMAIFFFVVGLEIKREIFEGALSDMRRAALPIAAAVGGMLVPAAIYAALNVGTAGSGGWGVPMATDIAFAVGMLTLLGKRVPPTLRVLLLAVAIIDDIGAILVIAIFYSSGFNPDGLVYIVGGLVALLALNQAGVRPGLLWVIPPLAVWGGMLNFGIHPTIAGVIVGLMTPIKPWLGKEAFVDAARGALDDFQRLAADGLEDHELTGPLNDLAIARREALGPAKHIENYLHPWVAFFIMPVFALANAGVDLGGITLGGEGVPMVLLGITLGLAVGKPAGIMLFSWISVRMGICRLPAGVGWRGLFVLGSAGGIGFTMALFISELAFAGGDLSGPGKLAVLIGTAVAALLTLGGGFILLKPGSNLLADVPLRELEQSREVWIPGSVEDETRKTRDGFQTRM